MEQKETKEKKKKKKLTEEQTDLIFKGIRPGDISYEEFKYYRRIMQHTIKNHLKGRFFFISSNYNKEGKRITQTHINNGNKLSS